MQSGHEEGRFSPGHAQEFETSFALAMFPENVRTEGWPDQPGQTPSLATAAKGKALIERIVERVTAYLRKMTARGWSRSRRTSRNQAVPEP